LDWGDGWLASLETEDEQWSTFQKKKKKKEGRE
jgi:hypothetical protein